MAIPPFPSQDLAKLVLGYLAEEQLMTAYDEFLLASPYLDALRNEYDRIFMTSLRNILAEYRAIKIYVETCKPFLLRKKLFQCSNLLEIVKFLVSYIDINRLHAQESNVDKISSSKNSSNTRSNVCDVCDSLSLETCECKAKTPKLVSMIHPASQIEASTLESSIETTALSDLPGNSVTKKKVTKDSAIETATSQTSSTEQVTDVNLKSWNTNTLSSTSHDPQLPSVPPQDNNTSININTQDIISKSDESKQKIEEFNNILNLVCSNNNSSFPTRGGSSQDCTNRTIPNAGTFQEFATGVNEIIDKEKSIVPDSSTSENFNIQNNARIESKVNISQITHIKGPPKAQFLLKVATSNSQHVPASNTNDSTKTPKSELPKIKSLCKQKIDDPKIKILSDVKVGKSFKSNNNKKGPATKPVTSTPLFQMQTILINGTPAYKNKPQQGTNFSYTKDEIMAMPTIILVPASGASQNPTMDSSSTVQSVNTAETTTTTTARMLGPLMIDTVSNNTAPVPSSETMDELIRDPSRAAPQMSSVQPIDITHSSVPKDTNLTVSNKTSTPHVLPPARKSSSTPRRTSHVRVLDFTTPRRILHETINEQDTNKMIPNEVVSGENNDIQLEDNVVNNDKIVIQKADSNTSITNLSTNATSTKIKKRNWDAELRALAVKNDDEAVITPKLKPEKSKINKKKVSSKDENVQETPESDKLTNKLRSSKKKLSPKTKKSKKKIKSVDKVIEPMEEKEPADKKALDFSMNPTVNIIRESDWSTMEPKENEDYQADIGKNNYSDERVDTPETERLSLQNVIGAKLNISDLLETPYKQVLYDIQMETPKFLGTDLPDDPISDIKIMNIPTPRFLATPKPVQATPSSYSSRLTDYSSGGSYYKPDDQDYIPAPEVLECAVTVVQEPIKVVNEKPKVTKVDAKDKSQKTSRPQRKCTKNVSYKSPNITARTKDLESQDVASVSSETSNTSLRDRKSDKSIEPRNRLKAKSKTESKKLVTNVLKSPLKKETPKKYIRIKPFRKTPVKETPNKGRKKTVDMFHTLSAKSLSRKRTTSKEKNTTVLPVLTAVPTKSRRKSSTPRKLHCTKSYNSDNANPNSSDLSKSTQNIIGDANVYCPHDSDTEQQPLRWSDDGSQDAKYKENQSISNADNDDISKIREYIENSVLEKQVPENEGSLHIDLVRRGFDVETARIIERDLLDATPVQDTVVQSSDITSPTKIEVPQNVSDKVEPDGSITNNLQIVQDEVDEEVELSVDECNEGCKNFVTCEFDESSFVPRGDITKLKDTFSMEVCIEDGVSIRLRATPFKDLYEENSIEPNKDYSTNETEAAVSSISNIDKLYTPMKDRRAQCFEIFDSTLTSIDTPLKSENNKDTVYETTVTEIVLEVENIEVKEKTETKKRKRAQSGTSDESLNKKTKPDTQYLLNSANIQNIDIESVLSKLHGP